MFKKIKKLLRFSITFKITVVYSFIFFLLLLFISGSVLGITGYFFYNEVQLSLQRNINRIIEVAEDNDVDIQSYLVDIAKDEELVINIYDDKEKLYFTTEEGFNVDSYGGILKPLEKKALIQLDNREFQLVLYDRLENEELYLRILLFALLIINITAVVVVLTHGGKATKKMLSPIEKMTETVRRISISDMNTRLDISGAQDELKELAETFNEMMDRLGHSYQKQNQFVSDASHELRTPISVLQGYANLLDRWGKDDPEVLQESILALKSESENMKSLVEKLLFLARADKSLQNLDRDDFSVEELLGEIIKDFNIIDSQHEFVIDANPSPIFHGDRKLIKQLIRIIIENSIKFTPVGGSITIGNKSTKNLMIIEVEDTGIGIPREDIPHIFERFYRADKSRTKNQGGQGLGLSIAKWIVDSHHGKIEVKSKLGKGTKFIIYLPYGLKEYYKSKA